MNRFLYSARWACLLALPLFFGLVSCNNDDEGGEPPRPDENIIEILNNTEGLDSLQALISLYNEISGSTALTSRLSGSEHTLFAPNNEAFARLVESSGVGSMRNLRSDLISDILFYHIVPNVAIKSTMPDSSAATLSSSLLEISTEGDSVVINPDSQPSQTTIVSADLSASNGVIHVIDEVLLPASVLEFEQYFGTVAGLTGVLPLLSEISIVLQAANAIPTLASRSANYLLLAPVDGFLSGVSFASNQDVINYTSYISGLHIIETTTAPTDFGRTVATLGGQTLYVSQYNGRTFFNGVQSTDYGDLSSNGRILYMPSTIPQPRTLNSVLRTFEGSGNTFNVMKNALASTELDLGSNRTIFIPTDSAFQKAGLITVIDSASRIDNTVLANILQTHVIDGINFLVDIVKAGSIETTALNGSGLSIDYTSTDNSASVTIQDSNAETENAELLYYNGYSEHGVVHIIDEVLQP
uniref:Fasciclin domain-containing protein n=1 Tax=Roseihalotalea indica TaxID=2867963 RepID=A0AA49JGQ7_9BACT|nr:fasciclin domain-containing protein [Tunicatimonas sp. TK19036]